MCVCVTAMVVCAVVAGYVCDSHGCLGCCSWMRVCVTAIVVEAVVAGYVFM